MPADVITIVTREVRESTPVNLTPLSEPYVGVTFISPSGKKWFLTVGDTGTPITTEVV